MLAFKILTGQQMGKVLPLKDGLSTLGRSPDCDIILASTNVSKKHASIEKQGKLIILKDLKSTNGCFVNGVKVVESKVYLGDKISFHDTVVEIVQDSEVGGSLIPFKNNNQLAAPEENNIQNDLALHIEDDDVIQPYDPPVEVFKKKTNRYFENTVLPGVYKLSELMDFQWVIGGFFVLVVVLSTSLSVIPLLKILRSSIEEASLRNVQNITAELVAQNKDALFKKVFSAIDLDSVYKKQGVTRAFITDIRGEIIAPARYAGKTPQIPKFQNGKMLADQKPFISFINNKTILAIESFKYYDPAKSIETTRYYGVVLYSVDTSTMDMNRTLSLFVQTLALSMIVAFILFFFVSRLISFPLRVLNRQVDHYLRTGENSLETNLKFPILKKLYSNLNSALSRDSSSQNQESVYEYDRTLEMQNIVELIGFPAVAIRAQDETISAFNPGFEEKTGLVDIQGITIFNITDQSLKLCLQDLLLRIKETPDQIITNELEFSGDPHEIAMQAVYGSKEVSYYVVSFIPMEADA